MAISEVMDPTSLIATLKTTVVCVWCVLLNLTPSLWLTVSSPLWARPTIHCWLTPSGLSHHLADQSSGLHTRPNSPDLSPAEQLWGKFASLMSHQQIQRTITLMSLSRHILFFLWFSPTVAVLHVRYLPERAAVGLSQHLLEIEEEARGWLTSVEHLGSFVLPRVWRVVGSQKHRNASGA